MSGTLTSERAPETSNPVGYKSAEIALLAFGAGVTLNGCFSNPPGWRFPRASKPSTHVLTPLYLEALW